MYAQIAKLKEQAKEKIISHGAFGETEIYWEINVDRLAELVWEEAYHEGQRAGYEEAILRERG